MPFPDYSQFCQLAQQGNFVPVYQELVADLDTPVAAWYHVCQGRKYGFLLESVESGVLGRYSLLGCDPLWTLEARGDRIVQTFRNGDRHNLIGNPFEHLATSLATIHPVKLPQLPASISGLVGFWGYELIKWIEPRVPVYAAQEYGFATNPDHDAETTTEPLVNTSDPAVGSYDNLPDGLWMQVDSLLIFDQVTRKIWVIAYADLRDQNDPELAYTDACDRVKTLVGKLRTPLDRQKTAINWVDPAQQPPLEFTSNIDHDDFCASVSKAKEYIKAGDIFQVVLSQRLSTPFGGDPFNLYRSLRLINPSPYMAYINFGDWQLIGSSPEVMVRADKDPKNEQITKAVLRPIAGTRPRGKTVAEDDAYAKDLLADPKEVAEHVMLVDLGRNDLGRVCQSGTVVVDELMVIERYSHVMHIVSNVVGNLQDHKTVWNLLQACFPAGTVSGAPKIRAMEIIHELEGDRRGAYAGAYGYYDFDGQLNTAITIRTMIAQNGVVSVQAGAGVVADSDPEREYQETLNKARGMLESIRCLA
ncbi:anthranilate synthase component I [Thalassoporum mexicanum PCC 7367]|uniref:anthranilate synthase component I family protein n=1 Tax=Thalassoporum mexicanum TaxID=3457544 RepID=UPI00029F8830|nr:anthranilate synthase component I family protein [Pseudanabaena sp. PCC 7367]AFY69156.1 anthranilate synthase component I [Pseudanabaena sp. PCC 7367]